MQSFLVTHGRALRDTDICTRAKSSGGVLFVLMCLVVLCESADANQGSVHKVCFTLLNSGFVELIGGGGVEKTLWFKAF